MNESRPGREVRGHPGTVHRNLVQNRGLMNEKSDIFEGLVYEFVRVTSVNGRLRHARTVRLPFSCGWLDRLEAVAPTPHLQRATR
eukprot:COSAG02_NODE_19172_length_896_cov_1.294856_1_plen_85_part_00